MDHHYHVGASATYEGFKDSYTFGRRANGIYVPRFRNISEATRQKDYLRGFGYQGGAYRGTVGALEGIGESLKEQLCEPGDWGFWIGGWGEQLPDPSNRVTLSKDKKDKWGLPLADISAEWNVKADAKACQRAFTAPWDIIITPLDTCGRVTLDGERYGRVRDSKDLIASTVMPPRPADSVGS